MPRRRVLVVDDERLLADTMADVLADHHDVEIARTAAEAMRRLREDGSFEVVLCDCRLPDGTSEDIQRAYAAAWPGRDARMVFFTGSSHEGALAAFLAGRRLVTKPFDLDRLPALVEEVAQSALSSESPASGVVVAPV